jgi:hypothetical protein
MNTLKIIFVTKKAEDVYNKFANVKQNWYEKKITKQVCDEEKIVCNKPYTIEIFFKVPKLINFIKNNIEKQFKLGRCFKDIDYFIEVY